MTFFLLGLLFSIPIGIIVNLLTPAIQARIEQQNSARAERARADRASLEEEIEMLAADPDALKEEMLAALLRLAYFGALFGSFASVASLVGLAVSSVGYERILELVRDGMFILSGLAGLVGILVTLNIARQALRVVNAARRLRTEAPG